MKLIKDKVHLAGEYYWIRGITSPHKLIQSITDVGNICCAVAGTRPLIYGRTLYGQLPGRSGIFSFYTESTGVYELARLTDGIVYYWERQKPKRGYELEQDKLPTMAPSHRGVKPKDEPWHRRDEATMRKHVIRICESHIYDRLPIEEACELHSLSHWGFETLFQSKWPVDYYEWKKNKTIPRTDQHTLTKDEWVGTVSSS